MKIVSMDLKQLDLRFLPLRRPKARTIEQMMTALAKQGQLTPIIVSEKILVDGFTRHEAAQRLGFKQLSVMAIEVDKVQAKAMTLLLNRKKQTSLIQEAVLVQELVEKDGLRQVDVASLLHKHKSWVSRRLLFIKSLAPEIIQDIQLELLPPGSGLHLARLPTCNQVDFSAMIQNHSLSVGEIRTLIQFWAKAPEPDVKKFLLASPREALNLYQTQQKKCNILKSIWKMILVLEKQVNKNQQLQTALNQVKANLEILEKNLKEES